MWTREEYEDYWHEKNYWHSRPCIFGPLVWAFLVKACYPEGTS